MSETIWIVVLSGAFATFMWRFAGVVIARYVKADSLFMVYVNAAAHAMVAGVMTIILVYPVGSLSETHLEFRLAGFGLALCIMLFTRKLGIAIVTGMVCFALLQSGFLL